MARASTQIAGVNAYLARHLGDRSYFGGDAFGWADIAVIPHVHSASMGRNAPPAGSVLAAWLDRVRSRPSVAATLKAAMASIAAMPPDLLPKLVEAGQIKREYRDHRLEWMIRSGGIDIVLEGMRKGTIHFSREID
jgi:glutathione S-transferase/RNA polymerase-associated protein